MHERGVEYRCPADRERAGSIFGQHFVARSAANEADRIRIDRVVRKVEVLAARSEKKVSLDAAEAVSLVPIADQAAAREAASLEVGAGNSRLSAEQGLPIGARFDRG